MNKSKFNIIILLIGVFFLSTSAIFVKVLDASAAVIAFYRLFFSGLMMLPVVLLNKRLRNELISLTTKQYFLGCISGLLLASHYVLWFESLNYTSVASSTVIVTLQPIFAVLTGYLFLKERVNHIGIMGIVLSIFGSGFIGWQDFQSNTLVLYGDFLALLASMLITGYFFVGQSLRRHISAVGYSLLGYFSSAMILFAYGILQQTTFTGYTRETWALFLCMAIFSTIFGQMLINWVLKWLNTTTVSVVMLTEVIWATLLSILILNERITNKQIGGIIIIIVGLLIYSYREKIELRVEKRSCKGK
ncbi:DMT family transporter [Crassaminicella profunda]|uniref:DMT family transporter n=1 Tax=Crassaminicella profunda TaxID=1286698 RepID=UPI001CA6698F|nr:DMT family transporter [Crassaminicella profunda]QZY53723.1 DMT family transporter [Crassaminicella profunda]